MKKDETARAYGKHGKEEKWTQKFWYEDLKEAMALKDVG
jgi:hypothetical protein